MLNSNLSSATFCLTLSHLLAGFNPSKTELTPFNEWLSGVFEQLRPPNLSDAVRAFFETSRSPYQRCAGLTYCRPLFHIPILMPLWFSVLGFDTWERSGGWAFVKPHVSLNCKTMDWNKVSDSRLSAQVLVKYSSVRFSQAKKKQAAHGLEDPNSYGS